VDDECIGIDIKLIDWLTDGLFLTVARVSNEGKAVLDPVGISLIYILKSTLLRLQYLIPLRIPLLSNDLG
jgi:hypothetical protein